MKLERLTIDAMGRRYLRNVSWRLVANVLAILVGAAAFPLVARKLGAEAYGQLAIVTSFAGLMGQIFGLRLWDAVVKYLAEFVTRGDAGGAWAVARLMYLLDAGTALLVFVVTIVAAPFAADKLLHAPLGALFVLAGVQALCGATSGVSIAVLRVFDRFRYHSSVDMVMTFGRAGLVLALVFAGWGVAGALVAYSIMQAVTSAVLLREALASLRAKFAAPLVGEIRGPLRGRLREIARFLFNLNFDTYRKAISANADTVILGYFAPTAVVGVYKVARQMSGVVGQLSSPMYDAIYPEIAREWHGPGRARVIGLIKRLSLGLGTAFVAGLALSLVAARPFILAVFGPEYAGAIPLFLVLLGTHVWMIAIWGPGVMYTAGRVRTHTLINFGSALVALAAMIALAPRFGAMGVAAAVVVQQVVWIAWLSLYLWTRRHEIFGGPVGEG